MIKNFIKKPMTSAQERIFVAAWDLFHERGTDGTSVDDILKQSDTGKSQFYHYFGSKDGLIHALLEQARTLMKEGEIEGFEPIDSWAELEGWFNCYIKRAEYFDYSRGCPLGRFAAELSKDDETTRKAILLVFEAQKQYLRDFFVTQKALGRLNDSADPESLADFCDAVIQGATTMAKLHHNEATLRRTFDHALAYLNSFRK